jgi:hypothetical protein
MIVLLPGQASDHTVWDHHGTPLKHYKMGFFHFSNNNLAIRKACAHELGQYDAQAKKSEDVDICFRVARSPQWVALREKGSFVRHKARRSFLAFVKQMWGWGYHVGYPYAKTNMKGIYLYWLSSKDHRIKFDLEIERFPWLVCMFWTDFHLAHVLLGVAFLAGVLGHSWLAWLGVLAAVVFFWRYLHDDRQAEFGVWRKCQIAAVHYIANVVFITATILGALPHRILLLPSSIFRPHGPEEDG